MNDLLTLDETLDDQANLKKLCKDRELITEEIFQPNAFYGHNKIIKYYAGIPSGESLKAVFLHGVTDISTDYVWEAEKKALVPVLYYYWPNSYRKYSEKTNKIVLPGTAPFVYVTKMLSVKTVPKREGTIFFPTHSSHHITSIVDFEKLANGLQKLDDKFKPVTICIYWRDYNLGHHKIFEEKGFKVVSAGHMFDPLFLFRFYHLCSTHKYSASNEIGSHLFYSVKAGCSFFFTDYIQAVKKGSEIFLKRGTSTPDPTIVSNLVELFSTSWDRSTIEQVDTVDEFLGVKNLKTPDKLRAELRFAENLDKFGFARHPESQKMYYRIANLIPRKLLRNIKHKIKTDT